MSDQYDDDAYDDDDDDAVDDMPERSDAEWAKLRRAEKARQKAEKELASLKREQAFIKAGLDPDDPKLSYFVKGYEGDITPAAIRAEAISAGFLTETAEQVDDSAVVAQARVQQAAGGGSDQPDLAIAAMDQAFASGGREGLVSHLQQIGVPVSFNE